LLPELLIELLDEDESYSEIYRNLVEVLQDNIR